MSKREKIILLVIVGISSFWLVFRSLYFDERKKRILTHVLSLWGKDIEDASKFFGVPVWRIAAIISQESQGDESAIGKAGEVGLMQIMHDAWTDFRDRYAPDYSLGIEYGLGQLGNGRTNIFVGTGYLRILFERFGSWPNAIKAYNSGTDFNDQAGQKYYASVLEFERQYFL